MLGLRVQDLPIDLLRLDQPTGLMERYRLLEIGGAIRPAVVLIPTARAVRTRAFRPIFDNEVST